MSVHSHQAAQPYPTAPEYPRHVVTAVIVAHDGARWLPQALSGLVGQERPVQAAIAADTGSGDDSADLLVASLGRDRVIHLARRTSFGTAVDEASRTVGPVSVEDLPYLPTEGGWDRTTRTWHDTAHYDAGHHDDQARQPVQWLWLLHDDCQPSPDALRELLRVADANPSAAVLGPKLLSWYDRRMLLETGVSIAPSGRRWTGLDRREQDQGQHDQVRPVLSVSSAGMLIRRDVWERLGGFDRQLPLMRDDLDFCWRVRAAGHEVLIAPEAVLRHAEAAARERRAIHCAVDRPHRVDKAGAVYTLLANSRRAVLPYLLFRLVISTLFRALGYLVGKVPGQAFDEVAGLLGVLLRPDRVLAARRRRGRPKSASFEPRSLFPPRGATLRFTVEQLASDLGVRRSQAEPSSGRHGAPESGPTDDEGDFLEVEQFARLRRIVRRPAPVLFAGLLLISLVANRELMGAGSLSGGAMLPAPEHATDLWASVANGWHQVGTGGTAPAPPYLAVVALLATLLFGNVQLAVTVLFIGSVPLAGLTAYLASRPLVVSRPLRAWASLAYALLPALTGALAAGRIGTLVLAVLLPPLARTAVSAAGLRLGAADLKRGERPDWRGLWATALLLTVVMAFTPFLWLVAVVLCVVTGVAWSLGGARHLVTSLAPRYTLLLCVPLLLLAPWSLSLLGAPSRFLLEAGLPYSDGSVARAGDLVLLSPGGPGALAGGVLAGVLLAALAALLRAERRRAILTAWGVALVGLLSALPLNAVTVTPSDGTAAGTSWPGPALVLYGLGLLSAAVVGAEGIRGRVAAMNFGWRQPAAALLVLAAALAPLFAAGAWLSRGAGDPLERREAAQVPAFVAEESFTSDRARTLVISGTPGKVSYVLVRGSGARLGDVEIAAGNGADPRLSAVVSGLLAGTGADQASQLADYAVRYVLVRDGAPRELSRVLDSTPGIARVSQDSGTALWRVDRAIARLTVREGEGGRGGSQPVVVAAGPIEAHTNLPSGGPGRILRLADAADRGWQAKLDGQVLRPITVDGWAQGFELPSDGGRLDLVYQTPLTHTVWLWAQGFGVLVVLVLALPGRGGERDEDLMAEAGGGGNATGAGDSPAVTARGAESGGRRARRRRTPAESGGASGVGAGPLEKAGEAGGAPPLIAETAVDTDPRSEEPAYVEPGYASSEAGAPGYQESAYGAPEYGGPGYTRSASPVLPHQANGSSQPPSGLQRPPGRDQLGDGGEDWDAFASPPGADSYPAPTGYDQYQREPADPDPHPSDGQGRPTYQDPYGYGPDGYPTADPTAGYGPEETTYGHPQRRDGSEQQ